MKILICQNKSFLRYRAILEFHKKQAISVNQAVSEMGNGYSPLIDTALKTARAS